MLSHSVNRKYLVTGDKRDFVHLYDQKVEGVTIISPVQFAQILKDIPRKKSSWIKANFYHDR